MVRTCSSNFQCWYFPGWVGWFVESTIRLISAKAEAEALLSWAKISKISWRWTTDMSLYDSVCNTGMVCHFLFCLFCYDWDRANILKVSNSRLKARPKGLNSYLSPEMSLVRVKWPVLFKIPWSQTWMTFWLKKEENVVLL